MVTVDGPIEQTKGAHHPAYSLHDVGEARDDALERVGGALVFAGDDYF